MLAINRGLTAADVLYVYLYSSRFELDPDKKMRQLESQFEVMRHGEFLFPHLAIEV
jgi:hypothetical protein